MSRLLKSACFIGVYGPLVELADTRLLRGCAEGRTGSNPVGASVKPKLHKSIANKLKKEKRVRVYSPDSWHPSFDGNTVEAALHYNKEMDKWWVSFCGDDDYGMNKSFDKYDEAKEVFVKTTKKPITQRQLKDLGFEEW